jgi:hypothetical protein
VGSSLCDSEIVPIVIRSSPRFLAETAGLVVPLCLGVVVYAIWQMSEPWSEVLPFVAKLTGVMAGVIVAFFGAMWLWYGSCKVTLNADQVVLARWGRTQFLAQWSDVEGIVLSTHVPKGQPRLELIVRTDAPGSTGRHSGATKGTIPLLLTWRESDDAADALLEECSRHGVHAVHRPVDERGRRLRLRLRSLIRKVWEAARRRLAP